MLLLEHLPVGTRLEIAVRQWVLGVDNLSKVVRMLFHIIRCIFHLWLDVYQLADGLADGFIEIDEVVVTLLEKGADVVSVVLKEGTLAVSRL